MAGRDWTGTCEHGFTGLPEDCFKCERESVKQAIAAAERRGREAGIRDAVDWFIRRSTGTAVERLLVTDLAIRALLPSQEAPTGGEACADCGVSLNAGEAKCFTVCDACWDKAHKPAPPAVQRPVCSEGFYCTGKNEHRCDYCDRDFPSHLRRP